MATVALGFQISASATQMASGINTAAVELQKLGYAAKRTATDVATLKGIEIGRVFVNSVQAVANTFNSFTSGAANAIDETAKLARSLGVSYQQLEQLQIAADLAGASSDTLARAFTRAQVTISEAGRGSKTAQEALGRLGLSVTDLEGRTSDVQFQTLANAIAQIADPTERAAAAVAVFGRSGAELLPVFAELGGNLETAGRFLAQFNGGITDEQARKVEAVNDAFTLVGKSIQQVAGQVLAELSPVLVEAADGFVDFISKIDVSSVANTAAGAIETLGNVFSVLVQVIEPIANNLLPAIGFALGFINAQAISTGISTLASSFVAAASASGAFSVSAGIAAVATNVLKLAIRGLLASTVIGAVVAGLGLLAEAAFSYADASSQAAQNQGGSLEEIRTEAQATAQAFASAQGSVAASGDAAAKALEQATKELEAEEQAVQQILSRLQGQANLSVNVALEFGNEGFTAAVAYQEAIREIQQQVERGILNETSAERAGEDAKRAFDQTINALKERQQLQQQLAEQERAIDEERLRTLSRADTGPLRFDDIRTSSGASQLAAFNREDPAVAEAVKQTAELRKIREKLTALEAPPVDIVGN
jgi:ribosomal protein S11